MQGQGVALAGAKVGVAIATATAAVTVVVMESSSDFWSRCKEGMRWRVSECAGETGQ